TLPNLLEADTSSEDPMLTGAGRGMSFAKANAPDVPFRGSRISEKRLWQNRIRWYFLNTPADFFTSTTGSMNPWVGDQLLQVPKP
ncbi:MAG: hypothetical protein AAGJ92_09780, partial [Pseudomonadota bacterium]